MSAEDRYDPPPLVRPDADRLKQWDEAASSRRVGTLRFGESNEPSAEANGDDSSSTSGERPKAPPDFSFMLLSVTKEIVFDLDKRGPVFHFIVYGIDESTNELTLTRAIEQWGDDEEDDDSALSTLAYAAIFHVPVFPRTKEVASELARLQARLNSEGFSLSGGKERYVHSSRLPENVDAAIKHLASQTFVSPADAALVAARLEDTLRSQSNASRLLAALQAATQELETCLTTSRRNEHRLQTILTRYPILFGTEYQAIIPKHKLGAEYEMDYALKRHSGLIDLVEIEASTHSLFNKKGDPTSALVHAEQQVLDWLSWIDDHAEYARAFLPGLARPIGYIVIGRSSSLSPQDAHRLTRRNLAFRGSVEIVTYDDLLRRAEQLLTLLTAA
ncbi:MAG: Shedu anti-phage system protein SduA domain-containing protein [Gaiellaceae bacterium]